MMRRGKAAPAAIIALVFSVVIALFVIAAPAGAQTTAPTIDSAELKLWPEYDDPGVLVIFSGQFAPSTTFPLQVAFPVPAGARNIQTTYEDASGSLINRPYEIKDGKLTYELPSAAFHLEYYVDRAPSGEQRNISQVFEAPYAVKALRVSVQEPARASGFTMTPAAESSQTGADGLTDQIFSRQNLAAGQKVDINLSYSKADTGLSAPQLALAAPPAAAASASTNLLPWLLIGLGLALLAGVLVYWLLGRRRTAAPAPVPAGKPRPVRAAMPAPTVRPASSTTRATGEPVAFCTNCGHALRAEDRFCAQCGAPRRS